MPITTTTEKIMQFRKQFYGEGNIASDENPVVVSEDFSIGFKAAGSSKPKHVSWWPSCYHKKGLPYVAEMGEKRSGKSD